MPGLMPSGVARFFVAFRWRWRRFVVRRRRLLVALSLGFSLAGVFAADSLYVAWTGSVLSGRPLVHGQILVRPVATRGAVVRDAGVRLVPVPVRPWSLLGLFGRLASRDPVSVPVDFVGRWRVPFRPVPALVPGFRYRVVVVAEGCPPRSVAVVRVGWLTSVRVDAVVRSCLPSELL